MEGDYQYTVMQARAKLLDLGGDPESHQCQGLPLDIPIQRSTLHPKLMPQGKVATGLGLVEARGGSRHSGGFPPHI